MEFLKKISLKVKVIFGVILGALGFVLFFFIREKMRAKDKLEYELSRVESELQIAHAEEDSEEKMKNVKELKGKETLIREKIKFLKEKEFEEGREVSLEELDAFFDNRGL